MQKSILIAKHKIQELSFVLISEYVKQELCQIMADIECPQSINMTGVGENILDIT
jgi:hypothetical protein